MANRRARKRRGRSVQARRETVFHYRGHTLEELQQMPLEEVLELLPSRVRRVFRRGLGESHKQLLEDLSNGEQDVRTHLRDMPILPQMVESAVQVYNGREFVHVEIQPEMIGHKLGEFAMTRQQVEHTGPGVGATRSSKYMPLK